MGPNPTKPAGTAVPLSAEEFRAVLPQRQAEILRGPQVGVHLREFLRLLVMIGRPRTCVPGLFAYVIGLGYAGPVRPDALTLAGAVQAFLVGFLANVTNTYTDVDEDCRNLPGRVWLLYRLGRRRLLYAIVALNVLMAALALCYGPAYLVFVLVGLLGLHQYSFGPLRMKARPFLGLYIFAQAVVGPFLIGWFGAHRTVVAPTGPALAMLAFLFLWFVAKGLVKNVPDYDGDRQAGLRTSATLFADRRAAAVAASAVTLAAYLSLPLLVPAQASPPRVLFATPWAVLAAVQCRRLVRAPDAATGNRVLRADMLLSSGFLGTVLLLQMPGWSSVAVLGAGAVILVGSDLLALDTRRDADANGPAASGAPAGAPSPRPRPKTPQSLFDRVAGRYDLFNSALSLGSDRRWRRLAAARVDPSRRLRVLDLATGTGGLATAVAARNPAAYVVGCDLNAAMLRVAREKTGGHVRLVRADGLRLPFADGVFDLACVAFAVDDMDDRERCAAELLRVLRPGGTLLLLELGTPENRLLRRLYAGGLHVMRLLGRSRRLAGYRHLREEILTYRGPDAIAALCAEAGFARYGRRPLTGGIAYLHWAERRPHDP
ncbi:class I SAM-dependent methyltransferase [Streptomyces sp. AV19]|uniref:class I SAM-dependent methyltransferase n=1 Tax=Streptomyces sp. AV19 TaxID=2793068 RepID=UPI0018FED04B|nr:class I SAM-dependent methyltransferase [Streptomyces sp. AV19]MBH1937756.1 class I SAM-dependent methyltransferase [Streptomyces sp. AV19]MDG4536425.1 class I SAM-dependent methyltransferase [Streptomyces sp. AV19]